MRPVNFPTIRLAQLAMLLHQTTHLFSVVVEALSVNDIRRIFSVTANDFWHYHYTLQQDSSFKKKTLGADMFSNIVINTLAPTLYAYGSFHKSEAMKLKAVRWLEELPAENNHVIAGFLNENVEARSAYDSQALLELKNEYCSARRCLDCSVGSHLLKEAAHTYAAGGKPENA
jgi:Asp-tRNA(Asn)/Glu-tRNA(Gln) amidotransferase A subunit family amidase